MKLIGETLTCGIAPTTLHWYFNSGVDDYRKKTTITAESNDPAFVI
jgi:hypothetical protein